MYQCALCIAEVHQWQPHFFEGDEVFFMPCGVKFTKVFPAYLNYRKVASTNTSCLEPHPVIYRLHLKVKLDIDLL